MDKQEVERADALRRRCWQLERQSKQLRDESLELRRMTRELLIHCHTLLERSASRQAKP
jgi:hypothetical protein